MVASKNGQDIKEKGDIEYTTSFFDSIFVL